MRLFWKGLVLAALAVPATAQMSDSYSFLKGVRDKDGAKVTQLLAKPGTTVVDTRDVSSGESALHIVTKRRDTQWLAFLLQKGARPDTKDANGNTPLLIAAQMGWSDGVSLLLDKRATPDLANGLGETPLMRAVQNRDLGTVKLLLMAGADPKRTDSGSGLTVREHAARDPRAGAILRELDAVAPKKKPTFGPS